jgi:hypothetical protein
VTIGTDNIAGINDKEGSKRNVQAETAVAHEGSHVKDDKAAIKHHFDTKSNISHRESEHRAFRLNLEVAQRNGFVPSDPKTGEEVKNNYDSIDHMINNNPHKGEILDDPIYKP